MDKSNVLMRLISWIDIHLDWILIIAGVLVMLIAVWNLVGFWVAVLFIGLLLFIVGLLLL